MEKIMLTGTVERGNALGRRLGYPTANIYVPAGADVPDGVYAIEADIEGVGEGMRGMANLGYRPTVVKNSPQRVLEFHLFGFEGDLYGRRAEVYLRHFIRSEMRFADTDGLRRRLKEDEKAAREFFAGPSDRI